MKKRRTADTVIKRTRVMIKAIKVITGQEKKIKTVLWKKIVYASGAKKPGHYKKKCYQWLNRKTTSAVNQVEKTAATIQQLGQLSYQAAQFK